jgi:hypothetical protein
VTSLYHLLRRPIVVPSDAPSLFVAEDADEFVLRTDKVQEFLLVPDRRPTLLLVDLTLKVPSE